MPEQVPDLSLAIHMAPRDAIAYFESKGYAISFNWTQVWQEQHARAFTVAGVARADILRDIRNALQAALETGQSEKWFADRITPILRRKGWWGKKEETDPETGEVREVMQGCPERVQLIFDQNIGGAFSAGRYKQAKENAAFRPFWQYVCRMLPTSRAAHKALNSLVFRHDDPFWDTHYPPNGYRCQCFVRFLSRARLLREGLEVRESAGHMVSREVKVYDRHAGRRRTRKVWGYQLPDGRTAWTDLGFSSNNAALWAGGMDGAMAARLGELRAAAPALFMAVKSALDTSPVMRKAYEDAVARVLDTKRTQGVNIYAGTLTPEAARALRAVGVDAPDVLVFPDERVAHANSEKHHEAGMALSREQFLKLPAMLRHMEWLFWDKGKQTPVYIIPDTDPEWVLVVPVELPGNRERKAPGLGVIVNAYRMPKKKVEGRQLVPMIKKE
ncbi:MULTISPECIES: phage minor head protein [unclassified Desulfovibrio]|uniref:phage head morphogenesis protein n=1 Tax=unclassified Desulfovibrio TaxID=2593640 RepID=UPI0013EC8DB8|nr:MULTISPECIES: phage minor head protein [unclassified Desulfovibrio]